MASYAIIKPRLRAVIGGNEGVEFNDCTQFGSVFALNTIPQGMLSLALGRNVDTQEVATIHRTLELLRQQQKVEVFLSTEVTDQENIEPGVPLNGEIKIFEGKTVGFGYRRAVDAAHFNVHLIHWLGDINHASAISASAHPSTPADLAYPAIFAALGGSEAGPNAVPDAINAMNGAAWVPMVSKSLVNEANMSDIWGEILWKWMNTVAQDDPFEINLFGGQPGGGDENVLSALAKMGPNAAGQPLNVDLGGANASVVAEGLRQAIMNETGGNWVNTTLWGKLVGEWAPAYWFSVVPRVEDTLIVPFTGGLRGEPWAVIGAEDYDIGDLNCQVHQVLRAVGILHPVMFLSGAAMSKGFVALDRGGFAGYYQPDNIRDGMVLTKEPPKWLMDPALPYEFTFCSQGLSGEPVGTTVDELTGNPCGFRNMAGEQASQRGALNNYAHQWYVLEALKGRTGEVASKLRFDIAPGSNVVVETGGARNVDGDALNERLYATVMQVSYMINAESKKAATAYSLTHIRTEAENQLDSTSVIKPPLYQAPWVGAKLVEDARVVREVV